MKNTQCSILAVTFALALGACATDEDQAPSTDNVAHSRVSSCESKPDFANWDEVSYVRLKQPELYQAALGAVLAAGAKCTEQGKTGCNAVSSDDELFAKRAWVFPFVACWKGTGVNERPLIECCVTGLPGPEHTKCDFAWINVGPTVPDQTPQ